MTFRLCIMKGTELIAPPPVKYRPSAIHTSTTGIRPETKNQNHETPRQSVLGHMSGLAHISNSGTTAFFPIYSLSSHSNHPASSELPTHSIYKINSTSYLFIFFCKNPETHQNSGLPKRWHGPIHGPQVREVTLGNLFTPGICATVVQKRDGWHHLPVEWEKLEFR
jgi:hypothetical protein